MFNLQTGEKTFVSRLRVRCSALDPSAARLRLTSLLQTVEVHPAGLAPSAIVCIRHLSDPRTRRIPLSGGHLSLPLEWQQSVRASIEQLVRGAAYPAREAVAPDALCVVFADRAELLAALAADWCEGRTPERWWWRDLFKEAINSNALVKLWQQTPEYVPGALEHLANRRIAARFTAALSAVEANAVLQSVMRRFALDELEAAISYASSAGTLAETEARFDKLQEKEFLPGTNSHIASNPSRQPDAAPWRRFVPESSANNLPLPQQQFLLGIGLLLQRAPALARSRNFALRVKLWLNALPSNKHPANVVDSSAKKTKEPSITGMPQDDAALKIAQSSMPDPVQELENSYATPFALNPDSPDNLTTKETTEAFNVATQPQGAQVTKSTPGLIHPDALHEERAETTRVAASETGLTFQTPESVARVATEVGLNIERGEPNVDSFGSRSEVELIEESFNSAPAPGATPDMWPPLEAQIETRYGGLFHLINLGLFLNLYGDFTSPAEPGIALSIWDFVALLGRRLAGGAGVENDPIWPLLSQLAGRGENQSPGEDFHPPDEWRVPVEWVRKFPDQDSWKWTIKRDRNLQSRLQLIHPAKFPVLDVPLETEANAEQQLAREIEIYAPVFSGTPRRTARPLKLRGHQTPLTRWVERLHLYTRARLQHALGIVDAKRLAHLLCERHARVFVTTTHVDIVMRLAELPFEVRVAGLDRDPGWVPAAGRIIAFHFE